MAEAAEIGPSHLCLKCLWTCLFRHTHLCWALRRLKRGLKCILGLTWHVSHWTPPVERRSHRHTCRPQQSLPHQTTWRHLVDTHYFCFFLSSWPTFLLCLFLVLSPAAVIYPDNKSISFNFSVRWWPCDAWSWGVTLLCHSVWEEKQCWVLSAEEYCFHTCVVFSCMLFIFENIWPI